MAKLASLRTRRYEIAVRIFRRVEVAAILHHVICSQIADMARRADGRVWRDDDIVCHISRVVGINRGTQYCGRVNLVETIFDVATFAVVELARIDKVERVRGAARRVVVATGLIRLLREVGRMQGMDHDLHVNGGVVGTEVGYAGFQTSVNVSGIRCVTSYADLDAVRAVIAVH